MLDLNKKILHCIGSMNRGGAETFLMNVLRQTDFSKYNISLLLNTDKGDYIDEIRRLGCNIYTISPRNKGFINYIKECYTFFKNHKGMFDIIHLHASSLSNIELLYLAKIAGVKKRIIHSHSSSQDGRLHKILHQLNKPFIKNIATDYLACSQAAANWMFQKSGVLKKTKIINNGIYLEGFKFNPSVREDKRKELNLLADDMIIINVSRFDDVKNHKFLIYLFSEIHKIKNNSKLILIGTGKNKNQIENQIKELDLEKDIIMPGVQNDVSPWLQASDIFIMPSLYEGLPVSLVEAQASGLPVLCSENVSKEVKFNNNVAFLNLDEKIEEWVKKVLNLVEYERISTYENLQKKGYDIISTVNYLYNNIYNN